MVVVVGIESGKSETFGSGWKKNVHVVNIWLSGKEQHNQW